MMQFAEAASQVESGKQIIGKQSLGEPDRSASGGALEANPRQINLDIGLLLEMGGGDVLVLGMGANTKPRDFPLGFTWRELLNGRIQSTADVSRLGESSSRAPQTGS